MKESTWRILLAISLAVVLCPPTRVSAQDYISPICTVATNQKHPVMSGHYIVWEDARSGVSKLYVYDLTDSTTKRISNTSGEQLAPSISGSKVVWQDNRNGNWDIYMYDISAGVETPLRTIPGDQKYPAIYGDTVVWQDTRNGTGNDDIFMINLSSMIETPVCTNSGAQMHPAVWRYIVVWEDYRNGNPDIYMYDLFRQEERAVCTDPSNQTNPSVWGKRIFWDDTRNSTSDIYMCYLKYWSDGDDYEWPFSAILDAQIPTYANQKSPRVMGDQVAFIDDRSGNWDVYLYRFHNSLWGDLLQITSTTKQEHAPVPSDNHVVWYDDKSTNPYSESGCDIFLWTHPPGADLSIAMHDDPDPVRVGSFVTYTVNVLNHGPGSCSAVTVKDTLPVGLMLVSAASTQGSWGMANEIVTFTLGPLDSGASALLTMTAKALDEGKVRNYAWVTGSAVDNVPRNNVASVYTTLKSFMTVPIDTGWSSCILLDKVGYPHVSYLGSGGGGNLKLADNAGGAWVTETIDSSGIIQETALCMDSLGNFHVSYVGVFWNGTNAEYSLYYRNNIGGFWNSPDTLLKNTEGCRTLSMACDRFGKIHIGYLKAFGGASPGSIRYVTNASGSWVDDTVSSFGYTYATMAIDTSAKAHFVFYNLAQMGGLLYTTNAPSGSWMTPEKVDPNWTGGQMEMMVTDIAIDRFNRPQVSFVSGAGATREDTRHAMKTAGGWVESLVDTGTFQSGGNYLAIDQNGAAYLCYYPKIDYMGAAGELRYATNASGSWVHGLIDEEPWMFGIEDDITVDAQGKMHVTFSHLGMVMYATNAEYTPHYGGGDNTTGGYFFANSMANDAPSHPTYDWIDPVASGLNEIAVWDSGDGDNGYFGPTYIGFGFPFFMNTFHFLYIGSNGYVSFMSGYLETAAQVVIPSPDPPDNFIAACAMDLDVRTSVYSDAHVYYGLHGNHFVVTYMHAHAKGSATDYITFQIILYPTGDMKFQYNNLESTMPLPNSIGNDALVGIESLYGVKGLMYRNNGAGGPLFGSPLAVAFGMNSMLLPVPQENQNTLPAHNQLDQNYPNPFNPTTSINYQLSKNSRVTLKVYDILGREVATVVDEVRQPGRYTAIWDARNRASGVYFCRLMAGAFVSVKKMILVR